ncbi:olfactory receptor 6E1-like [Pleurodeles waltl]|uniref:olfactory receptor 6E1-like n=1 Tax=Pleurodeles waltl TaxID=8319 RepID=UPI003709A8EB
METRNTSTVTKFILVGFTGSPELRIFIFIFLLIIYITTILGNVVIIVVVAVDRTLQTPMYFFLWNLSVLETFNISNIVPLMLAQIFKVDRSISIIGCFTQCFVYFYLATIVFYLMPIMSYDRYVAICNPLRYTTIMHRCFCIRLIIGSWLGASMSIMSPTVLLFRLPFCGPNIIDHLFCDSLAIMRLACTDTTFLRLTTAISALIFLPCSLGLTIVSYVFIASTILRIPSTNGRRKAFSTCSSHLFMVTTVYGSAIFVEASPVLPTSRGAFLTVHMFTNILSPLINPYIYTIRNEKFKEVLKKQLHCKIQFN